MRLYQQLFTLFGSLEKTERKVVAGSSRKRKSRVHSVFNALSKSEVPDEVWLKQVIERKHGKTNFSKLFQKCISRIIQSLSSAGTNVSSHFSQAQIIEFYINRGLYSHAHGLLKSLIRESESKESFHLNQKLREYQRTISIATHGYFSQSEIQGSGKLDRISKLISELSKVEELAFNAPTSPAAFVEMLLNPLLTNSCLPVSVKAEFYRLEIKSMILWKLSEWELFDQCVENAIEVAKSAPYFMEDSFNKFRYISMLSNLIISKSDRREHSKITALRQELRELVFPTEKTWICIEYYCLSEISYYFTQNPHLHETKVKEIEEIAEKHLINSESNESISLFFSLSRYFFYSRQTTKSKYWANVFLKKKNSSLRVFSSIAVRFYLIGSFVYERDTETAYSLLNAFLIALKKAYPEKDKHESIASLLRIVCRSSDLNSEETQTEIQSTLNSIPNIKTFVSIIDLPAWCRSLSNSKSIFQLLSSPS